jgi:hypothetical protein
MTYRIHDLAHSKYAVGAGGSPAFEAEHIVCPGLEWMSACMALSDRSQPLDRRTNKASNQKKAYFYLKFCLFFFKSYNPNLYYKVVRSLRYIIVMMCEFDAHGSCCCGVRKQKRFFFFFGNAGGVQRGVEM